MFTKLNQLAKKASEGYSEDVAYGDINEVSLWELAKIESMSYSELLTSKEEINVLMKDIEFFSDKTIKSFIDLMNEINRLLKIMIENSDCKSHKDLTNELLGLF